MQDFTRQVYIWKIENSTKNIYSYSRHHIAIALALVMLFYN